MNNNTNELYNKIIKNGGFTIDKELKDIKEKNGFIVSILGKEKTFTLNQKNEIIQTIKEYQKELKKNEYIGARLDDGLIYIDISKHYTSKQNAILTGIKNKQLSIFDLKNNTSIDLLKNVYIVYKLDKIKNDIRYIKEYNSIKDLQKEFKLANNSIYNYIIDVFNDVNDVKNVLNDKYIIIRDKILISEL